MLYNHVCYTIIIITIKTHWPPRARRQLPRPRSTSTGPSRGDSTPVPKTLLAQPRWASILRCFPTWKARSEFVGTCPPSLAGLSDPLWLLSPQSIPALDPLSQACPSPAAFNTSGLKPLHLLPVPRASAFSCSHPALASLLCPGLNSPSGSPAPGSQVLPGSGGSALNTLGNLRTESIFTWALE